MRASFPTAFVGALLGKSRERGEFEKGDGVKVSYDDAYLIGFENSDGLTQTVQMSLKQLDDAADFDVAKAPAYTQVNVRGDVRIYDDGGAFKPTEVRLVKAA
jgi:hypothetical protein